MLSRIEKQLKRRFAIGSQVSEHSIVQDFMRQVGQGPHGGLGCGRDCRLSLGGETQSPVGGWRTFLVIPVFEVVCGEWCAM